MQEPLVSVIIPAYNAEPYLRRAIDSILVQTYPCIEIIVVNDGSTDGTIELVNSYKNQPIHLISKVNGGMSSARNTGLRAAQGEFIAYLDADDYWMPAKITSQVTLLQNHPEIGFCSTSTKVETPDGFFVNEWSCPNIQISTLHTIFINNSAIAGSASSILVRKSIQDKAGMFDETLTGLEDTDMWIRYAALSEYICIADTLTVILKRSQSVSRNLNNMRASAIAVYKKNRFLLDSTSQGRFWKKSYARMLTDYAKWEARENRKCRSLAHLCLAFCYAPFSQGKLCASLAASIILGRRF